MSSVMDLLKKLIGHEQSARSIGSIAEAEAFASKIQKLLFDNKLSMSEVEMEAEAKNEPVMEEEVACRKEGHYNGLLAMAIADFSFCKVIQGHNGILFIGGLSNRQACIAMFNHLSVLGEKLAQQAVSNWKNSPEYWIQKDSYGAVNARKYRNSFLMGYSKALSNRIKVDREKLIAGNVGNALVYIDKNNAAIDVFIAVKHPRLRNSYARVSSHSSAYKQGHAAGSNVSLSARHQLR